MSRQYGKCPPDTERKVGFSPPDFRVARLPRSAAPIWKYTVRTQVRRRFRVVTVRLK